MACRMVVEEHIATVHMTLIDVDAGSPRQSALEFPEIFDPDVARTWDPEGFKAELARKLTEDARRLLPTNDVTVEVTWERSSLEIAAIMMAGKVVADIGAFLAGVRSIRDLFPQRIREEVSGWLGRPVAAAGGRFEAGTGLLNATAESEDASTAGPTAPSVQELRWYAVLSLGVLVVVVAAVIVGVAALGVA